MCTPLMLIMQKLSWRYRPTYQTMFSCTGIKYKDVLAKDKEDESDGQETAPVDHYSTLQEEETTPKGYYSILKQKINKYLSRELSPNYKFLGETYVAVQFRYRLPEKGYMDVDLLLSPYWDSQESYWRDLALIQPPLKRLTFSVSTSKYQTAFIKAQPQRVGTPHTLKRKRGSGGIVIQLRELIRRAKAWRNVIWQDKKKPGKPKSYLMSLLVITAYDRLPGDKQGYYFKQLAREVGKELDTLVQEIASDDDLDLIIPGTNPSVAHSNLLPPRPRIIDPVNPANNVYLSGIGPVDKGKEKWQVFREEISSIDITITAERIMKESGLPDS